MRTIARFALLATSLSVVPIAVAEETWGSCPLPAAERFVHVRVPDMVSAQTFGACRRAAERFGVFVFGGRTGSWEPPRTAWFKPSRMWIESLNAAAVTFRMTGSIVDGSTTVPIDESLHIPYGEERVLELKTGPAVTVKYMHAG